jgi:Tol biopolymer transport system component
MLIACSGSNKIDFLGQTPPDEVPKIFAPDIVSTELDEFGCTMSPDGREFYFTRTFLEPRRHTIMVCRLESTGWSQPEIADFSGQHAEAEPNFSPDGRRLFFGRLRVTEQNSSVSDIYVTDRTADGWREPEYLMPGMFASISNNDILYFTDISRGMHKGNIATAEIINNEYSKPELLDASVNSTAQDAHPFIAPDESYILFDSNRPGGYGSSDLYICFRDEKDSWGDAISLGEPINTPEYDAIPSVSPGGEYLFFCRTGDIYWVATSIIKRLQSEATKK